MVIDKEGAILFFSYGINRFFKSANELQNKYGEDADQLEKLYQLARKVITDIERLERGNH